MSTEPVSTQAAELALKLAKQGRDKLLLPFLIKKIITKVPWLGAGVFNPLLAWLVGWGIDVFYDEGVLLTFFGVTDVVVWHQRVEYKEALGELEEAIKKHSEEGNHDEIQKASEEFDRRLADLIRF